MGIKRFMWVRSTRNGSPLHMYYSRYRSAGYAKCGVYVAKGWKAWMVITGRLKEFPVCKRCVK